MKLFQKLQRLNLWFHATLVVVSVTLLVGLSGFKIIGLPLIFIFGIGDGYPNDFDKAIGILIIIFMAAIALCIVGLIFALFYRMFFDKTKSPAFRSRFTAGLVCVLCANYFLMWKTNHEEWESMAVDRAKNNALEKDDPVAYEAALNQSKYVNREMELRHAAFTGKLKIVQYLISKGVSPNANLPELHETILDAAYSGGGLHYADNRSVITNHNKAVIDFLISHGATNCHEETKKFYESLP